MEEELDEMEEELDEMEEELDEMEEELEEEDEKKESRDYLVYCIVSTSSPNRTYVGITNNWPRRIKQHDSLIKGGAKSTQGKGPWKPLFHITGFTKRESLQLEWALKHRRAGTSGPKGRVKTLQKLLHLPRWTNNAPLLCEIAPHMEIRCALAQEEFTKMGNSNLCKLVRYVFNYEWEVPLMVKKRNTPKLKTPNDKVIPFKILHL
jgi:predicted GIY-YIG superfamily endonuclease